MNAVFLFFFTHEKYIDLAKCHSMAVSLESEGSLKAFEEGVFPSEEQQISTDANIRKFTKHLKRKLFVSFVWIILAAILALGIGYFMGTISPNINLSVEHFLIFIGTALASWGTLFELGGGIATWSGEALHEIIHPIIFQILFIPGILLMLAGTIL